MFNRPQRGRPPHPFGEPHPFGTPHPPRHPMGPPPPPPPRHFGSSYRSDLREAKRILRNWYRYDERPDFDEFEVLDRIFGRRIHHHEAEDLFDWIEEQLDY